MPKTKLHNTHYCMRKLPRDGFCPCLTCAHDKKVKCPETDTMCCDLIGHRARCTDLSPCPDYEQDNSDDDGGNESDGGA